MNRNIIVCLVIMCCCGLASCDENPARFEPPDRDARARAVGDTRILKAKLSKAFRDDQSFSPIPVPQQSDWLARHTESGQTFEQYLHSRPNRPTKSRGTIDIQPLGEFPDGSAPNLDQLQRFAQIFFAMPVRIRPVMKLDGLPIKRRERAHHESQISSLDVLNWLRGRVSDDAYCLLAVTMEDLYPNPKWNFVFGQASLRHRVGVYSFARYEPSFYGIESNSGTERLVLNRSCKVLAHETGHMFGIKHCVHFHCLMNGSNHLQETDAAPIHLCPVCLRKLYSSTSFDIVDRYEKLKAFADSVGWNDESDWLEERMVAIGQP